VPLHWWYGQSDALLGLCLLELHAEQSLSGQLASLCPSCSHKLQSSPWAILLRMPNFRTCCTRGVGNRMTCSSYAGSNCTQNKACLDNRLFCARVGRISCKLCIRARNVRRPGCCSECRYDSGTPCCFDGTLHLCILCNYWDSLCIRLLDFRSYSDRKPSRRGPEIQNESVGI
jgi:hypothetical protein